MRCSLASSSQSPASTARKRDRCDVQHRCCWRNNAPARTDTRARCQSPLKCWSTSPSGPRNPPFAAPRPVFARRQDCSRPRKDSYRTLERVATLHTNDFFWGKGIQSQRRLQSGTHRKRNRGTHSCPRSVSAAASTHHSRRHYLLLHRSPPWGMTNSLAELHWAPASELARDDTRL